MITALADEVTVKLTPLLDTPPTVTTTLPVVAPAGTGTTTFVALQIVGVAAVPLNVTVLDPCVEPKFVPVMVTEAPTAPELGDSFVIARVLVADPENSNTLDGIGYAFQPALQLLAGY
jgi:hypothetical protein